MGHSIAGHIGDVSLLGLVGVGVPPRKASGSGHPLYSSLVPRCGVPLLSVTRNAGHPCKSSFHQLAGLFRMYRVIRLPAGQADSSLRGLLPVRHAVLVILGADCSS